MQQVCLMPEKKIFLDNIFVRFLVQRVIILFFCHIKLVHVVFLNFWAGYVFGNYLAFQSINEHMYNFFG